MTLYRDLPLLSKILILSGGFNVQFGLVFFNAGLFFAIVFIKATGLPSGEMILPMLAPLIFTIIGLIFTIIGINRNMKALQLLQYGIITSGKLKNQEYTNVKINNIPEMLFTFEFIVNEKNHLVKGRTHEYHLVSGEKNERIIYNPENPDFAILYDLIPNAPVLNQDQSLQPVSIFRSYLLLLPVITVIEIFVILNTI